MKKEYNKLVRVDIPAIIKANGRRPVTLSSHQLDPKTQNRFKEKLQEEMQELIEAKSRDEVIEEAADVLQVLLDYVSTQGFSCEELEIVRRGKEIKRGGFLDEKKNGVFLVEVSKRENNIQEN